MVADSVAHFKDHELADGFIPFVVGPELIDEEARAVWPDV
jgi:hypothetical protein